MSDLNAAQRATVDARLSDLGAGASFTADRDEPHDEHVFVCLYRPDRTFAEELCLEGDGWPAD